MMLHGHEALSAEMSKEMMTMTPLTDTRKFELTTHVVY